MLAIDLKSAVREIRQGCTPHVNKDFRPFFFIVGAGISSPPIPLAAGIAEHCQSKAIIDGVVKIDQKSTPIENYSYWFDSAYPHAAERRTYLHELIHNKPISPANLRLAHILESGQLADIVVTSNFDDLLARGLTLFGKYFTQCDHPQMAARIDPERHDIVQIVHVHGTYWFYDCCNLKDEVVSRSAMSAKTTATMANLLDRILAKRSPLVVGYSGWEDDVIMSALRRRLDGQSLAYRLYWFCYRAADCQSLPGWLRDHQDVRFILPSEAPSEKTANKSATGIAQASTEAPPIDGRSSATLGAQEVMDAIVQGFSLPAPKLTTDPLAFYAEHLKSSVIHDEDDTPRDLYGINAVISRISHANALEKQQRQANEESLEQIRDSLRRSAYQEVIDRALAIDSSRLDRQQCEALMQTLNDVLKPNLVQNSLKNVTEACDLMIRLATSNNAGTPSEKDLSRIGSAIYCKGYFVLTSKNDPGAAVSILDELVRRFDADVTSLRRYAAIGRYYIAIAQQHQNSLDAAIESFENIIRDFNVKGAHGRDMAIWAMLRMVEIHCGAPKIDRATDLLNQAKAIIAGSSDPLITVLSSQVSAADNLLSTTRKVAEVQKVADEQKTAETQRAADAQKIAEEQKAETQRTAEGQKVADEEKTATGEASSAISQTVAEDRDAAIAHEGNGH